MQRAIHLARKGLYTTNPNPRVGCVIVKNNNVIGEGFHRQAGEAHAEVFALKAAGDNAQNADVYVTLEPCCHFGKTPPCSQALIKAKVKRVFIACLDPNPLVAGNGILELERAGISVYSGLLYAESAELNKGFFKRMQQGLPWVRIKMAMSLDGRTAMASGQSKWITGVDARKDVQKLRARSSAILTAMGTVLADNPSMNVRIDNDLNTQLNAKQPLLVILDAQGRLTGNEKLFTVNKLVLIYTKNNKLKAKLKVLNNVEIVVLDTQLEHLNLQTVLKDLAKREINELHVECGSTLAGAFVEQQLFDEIVVYIAPKLMGSNAMPLFKLPLSTMAESVELDTQHLTQLGKDIKLTLVPTVS